MKVKQSVRPVVLSSPQGKSSEWQAYKNSKQGEWQAQMRSTRVNKVAQSVSFASPRANNCESQDYKESKQGEGDREICKRRWVMNVPSTSCATCRACKTTCPKVRMPRRHGSKARVDANANDDGSSMSLEQALRLVVLACPHATSSEC